MSQLWVLAGLWKSPGSKLNIIGYLMFHWQIFNLKKPKYTIWKNKQEIHVNAKLVIIEDQPFHSQLIMQNLIHVMFERDF